MTVRSAGGPVSQTTLARTYLTIAMNVLFFLAVALTTRVAVEFFGTLAMASLGTAIVAATEYLVLPLGLTAPRTPYGGVFDTDAAVTVVVLLLVEWLLSLVRARA